MRIISKFHDYYDSAMGYGQDPNLIYRRESQLLTFDRHVWKWEAAILDVLANKWPEGLNAAILGFSGRFSLVHFPLMVPFRPDAFTDASPKAITEEQVRAYYTADVNWNGYETNGRRDPRESPRFIPNLVEEREKNVRELSVSDAIFRDLGAPIFLLTGDFEYEYDHGRPITALTALTNPRLATLGFQTQLDPFTAFQEIATFLGSALATENQAPRTVGDDKIIAASKGFDEQSFRTQAPGTKKINRQENRARKRSGQ